MAGAFLGGLNILSCLSTVNCSDCDILLEKKREKGKATVENLALQFPFMEAFVSFNC